MTSETEDASGRIAALLVDNHRQFLQFLERRLGSRELAEDVLQDAFVKSIEKTDALREEQSAVAWFYRMLRNAVIDLYRRAGVRAKALQSLAREMDGAVEAPPQIRDAICACVLRLSEALKQEYAEAIRRIDIDGVAVTAYANEAGISPSNAGVRVFRAREALRKQVTASCGSCAEHGCLECSCR